MRLIHQSVEIVPQEYTIEGSFKQIELASRVCYKSEDKITEHSAGKFVEMLTKRGHGAALEHGTFYLKIPIYNEREKIKELDYDTHDLYCFFRDNHYSRVYTFLDGDCRYWIVTTNYRVLAENAEEAKHCYSYICDPNSVGFPVENRRYSVRIICSRAIANEIVRHREGFSYCQESTRYCNYFKDKFGNEITFILPSEYNIDGETVNEYRYAQALKDAEEHYLSSVSAGVKPERARDLLPLATKTELVMTGYIDSWKHFFELRTAPQAHPDMQELAKMIRDVLNKQLAIENLNYRFEI